MVPESTTTTTTTGPIVQAAGLSKEFERGQTKVIALERVDLAVERGEAPAGTDPDEVILAVSAPLYYRLLASGDPLDEAAADTAAAAATAAARAGVFVRPRG